MKKTLSLLLVSACLLPIQLRAQRETKLQKKLRTIVINHLEVEDASVEAVIKLLRVRAKDLDPQKEGVNIVLFLNPPRKKAAKGKKVKKKDDDLDVIEDEIIDDATGKNEKTVTLMFSDLSLREALKNICRAADLIYKEEQYAVVIAHKDFPISKMETRIYPVDPDTYLQMKDRLGK